ncbi:MAG: hypothetical protein IJW19_03615 [Clostridia bacterium]|nr:hypothetical protein [Clostridia bacterium]
MYRFEHATKEELNALLPKLFEILHSNMSIIAPTGNTYSEDFEIWLSNVYPALMSTPREIIVMYDESNIIGYFQYYINGALFMMEEIQIKQEYQGAGVFSAFYSWLIQRLPMALQTVEAYANKLNEKSQGILTHLGLSQIGENKGGSCYHYKGDYKNLQNKYNK